MRPAAGVAARRGWDAQAAPAAPAAATQWSPRREEAVALHLVELPFSTIPLFVLPLIFLTHLLVFWRLRVDASGEGTAAMEMRHRSP